MFHLLCIDRTDGSLFEQGIATVILLAVIVFLSFYFSFLALYAIDDSQKAEFVFLAASSTVAGLILRFPNDLLCRKESIVTWGESDG